MSQINQRDPAYVPCSTYRLQMNRLFPFAEAAAIAEYLDNLGITDLYLSPFLAAHPGSLHGYDIVDHSRINPEIGSEDDLAALVEKLQARGMGIIADVVPNHMCVDSSNAWWWDVLENGPASPYARFFDIDWQPPKEELAGKVLLPELGDQYGRVLESGLLAVEFDQGAFSVAFYDKRLPLSPRSGVLILGPVAGTLRNVLGADAEHTLELESILTAISHLPHRNETDEAKIHERLREKEIIKRRIAALVDASPQVRDAIDRELRSLNGTPGDPRSFDRLERLLSDQGWRLAFWPVAADEINYRRFFDINSLGAIRVEDAVVFHAVHQLIFQLVERGWIRGLRIDHPDGLLDPAGYFQDVQTACGRSIYQVAEKIVMGDEQLRPNWAIEGTTGYGYLNLLNGLFVDSSKKAAFARLYRSFTGWSQSYADLVYQSKELILQVSMSAELNVLARRLDHISEQHRFSRDFTLESLRNALQEVVTCFPVYRTYITYDSLRPDQEDERHIRYAVAGAKRRNPAVSESVFDFIQSVLLLEDPDGLDEAQRDERRLFVLRLQQFTGPVMAKGVEDTAFYRYFPLASLNEVGGEPEDFGTNPQLFHAKNFVRREFWQNALLASSTHDSKRSEDVRARINALSEIPGEWLQAIRQWHRLNRDHKTAVAGEAAPTANDEYLLYQTLAGAWPLEDPADSGAPSPEFIDRIREYMRKSLREAKTHSSWVSPNGAYEDAVSAFLERILDPAVSPAFLQSFVRFQAQLARAGMLNSLSQVVLKIASPGVPDFYQGSEIWNFTLVDPDNRHPVDYSLRAALLERIHRMESSLDPREVAAALIHAPFDGAIKLYLTRAALHFRRLHRELFSSGAYHALRVVGPKQRHAVAFARQLDRRNVIAVAGRLFLPLGVAERWPLDSRVWKETAVLPRRESSRGPWRDVLTGRLIRASGGAKAAIALTEVFEVLPVALLVNEDDG